MTQATKMQVLDKNNVKILVIGFVWPEVTSTAASQNIVSYLRTFVDAGHQVHFACAAQRSLLSTDLSQMGVETHDIALNCASFDALLEGLAPQVVMFDRFLTEEQFGWRVMKAAPDALRVLDCEDLHFVRHARHQLYKSTGYQPRDPIYLSPEAVLQPHNISYLYNDITCREMASIYRCDLSLTLSSFEHKLLINQFNLDADNIALVPYLIEHTEITPAQARRDFISIGNFRHAPNIDAVNVLVQHIWPEIFKRLPETKCHIYGAYMPPRIKQLHNPQRGLHVHGHVENHIKALSQAKILLAPIQFGAGVKGKIVDALRCALPSITTPIGTEGIVFDRWPGAQESEREAFIDSAVNTYLSSHDHTPLIESILRSNYATPSNKAYLLDRISVGYHQLSANRAKNFMQKMVSHHSLQTHQYMSQWIAAKNAVPQQSKVNHIIPT
jgi:glycosyltransferase involved in cell wall biosynthesis